MTVNKRKKLVRFRAKTSHGKGHKKKGRGAGSRGGRGMAGTGKRAGQKKPTILKKYGNSYFGKHGFNRPSKSILKINAINLHDLEILIKDKEVKEIELTKLGFNKLLGSGKIHKAYKIKVPYFSKRAKDKIEKVGGTVSN